MLRKIAIILYQPYKWLVFLPIVVLATCFYVFFGILVILLFNDSTANRTTGVWWARTLSFFTPMTVTVLGRENIHSNQSYIIVANHQSNYDILLLYGWLGIDIKWVIKKELRKVPVFGLAAEMGGNIIIDRSDPARAYESLKRAKEKVVDGTSIVILPEGTRSQSGEVHPFKKGAFLTAMDLGLPVLPITIDDTRKILRPGTLNLFPGRAKMLIHKPVESRNYSSEKLEEFIRDVEDIVRSGMAVLRQEEDLLPAQT